MEGEMKRKIFAVVEELEVDLEGSIILAPIPEVYEEPSVAEAPQPEVVFEAPEEAVAPEAMVAAAVDVVGEVPAPKYVNKNFAQKMMLADEVIQDRYDEVKNYALRFKKLKARISKKFESINQGRLQFVKLSVAGKTLKLYLNMDVSETDPKFRCKDMSDKVTYETVPTMLRIKSGRAVRYAKILIDQCAAKYGLVENKKFVEVDAMQVIEDFLKEREAKKLAKLGMAPEDDDMQDDILEAAEEAVEEAEEVALDEDVEAASEEVQVELSEEVAAEEPIAEEPAAEEAAEEAEEMVEPAAEEPAAEEAAEEAEEMVEPAAEEPAAEEAAEEAEEMVEPAAAEEAAEPAAEEEAADSEEASEVAATEE